MKSWISLMPKNLNKQIASQSDEQAVLLSKMNEALPKELEELLTKAKAHEKWPIARLISIFERNTTDNLIARHQIISYLNDHPGKFNKQALVLGITGTPGAGKSSLIGETCLSLLKTNANISIAVLAIDPSSHDSGGALLGDRTRVIFPVKDNRLFFRSQASQLDLGGMSKRTFHVTRLLRKLFDVIIIETVGIGQSEIEIQRLSDHTCLVMQPLAGDQVQFMKAGIMEIPDTFIINKCDEDALAKRSLHLLKSSLKLASIYVDHQEAKKKNIFLTSATKRKGIDEFCQFILEQIQETICQSRLNQQEEYFLHKWVKQAYGEFGMVIFEHHVKDERLCTGTLEQKELRYKQIIADFLTHLN
jgi:LAO/AO transport system kinase